MTWGRTAIRASSRLPGGLDLGAETPEEIALSILAELVQVRRGRAPFVAAPGPATFAGGVVYAFCSVGCRTAFVTDPSAYLPTRGTPVESGA